MHSFEEELQILKNDWEWAEYHIDERVAAAVAALQPDQHQGATRMLIMQAELPGRAIVASDLVRPLPSTVTSAAPSGSCIQAVNGPQSFAMLHCS